MKLYLSFLFLVAASTTLFGAHGSGLIVIKAEAEADGLASDQTAPLSVVQVVEVVMPQYIQGEQNANGNNNDRTPFAFRLRLEGLLPNAVYRYGNRMIDAADPADQNGAGNAILITGTDSDWIRNTNAPTFNPEDFGVRHWIFDTDSSGAYEGWFVTEPTGNVRFTPGNTLYVRLLLNDGQGGTAPHHFVTAPSGIEVRRFGSGSAEASALYGDAGADPRNLVLLFDNTEGSGRPLSATVVEETGSEVDNRYSDFYLSQVAGRDRRWGTLLPNTLPSGVRRIEERSLLTGELMTAHIFSNGLDGSVDPMGGPNPFFADIEGGNVFLPVDNGAWEVAQNWSAAAVPNGIDERAIVNMTASADRTISVNGAISLGTLTLNHETSFRDRIDGGTGASFTFVSSSGEAGLLVGRQGNGFHELRLFGGIHLNNDLRVTVNNVTAEGEYGALRIRETLQGSGALIKDGFGVLSLTGGDKNHTGATRIENGVLRVTEASQPQFTSGVHVTSGGQLRLVSHGEGRHYEFGGKLFLDSLGPDEGPVALPQGGRLGALRLDPELELRSSLEARHTATVANDIEFTGDSHIHIDGTVNRLTLTGDLGGTGALIKSGGGDLVLTGANSLFEGGTLQLTGAVYVEPGSSLGQGPLVLDAASGNNDLELFLGNAAQTVAGLAGEVGGGSATIRLVQDHLLTVDQNHNTRFEGSITGSASVRKRGAGLLHLGGGPNDFTGMLEIEQGVVEVTESSRPSAVSGIVVEDGGQLRLAGVGSATFSFGSSPLLLQGAGRDPAESGSKGALRLQGGDVTDVATVTNPIELIGDVAWFHANRDIGDGSVLILAGEVSGAAFLRKTGAGTLELRGGNAGLVGGTVIENGLLRVAAGSRLGAGPMVFVDPERERAVELTTGAQTVSALSGAIAEAGSIRITLGSGHTLTVDQAGESSFEGSLEGAGDFVKSGSGVLMLVGESGLTGDILLHEGTLRVDGSLVAAGRIGISEGATLEGSGVVPGLSGAGVVVPGGATPGILDAVDFDGEGGLGAAFLFSRTGSPDDTLRENSGNALLRLSGANPFPNPLVQENKIAVYLDVDGISSGDIFRGGFFTSRPDSFDQELAGANIEFYIKDPGGESFHRGAAYRRYDGPLYGIVDTVPESGGSIMRVRWTTLTSFSEWRSFHFRDPLDRDDSLISGPYVDLGGDGMTNLMKYAVGLGPWERLTGDQLSVTVHETLRLLFRFFRDPNKTDIAYLVEGSFDLSAWEIYFDSREFLGSNSLGDHHEVWVPTDADPEIRAAFARLRVVPVE